MNESGQKKSAQTGLSAPSRREFLSMLAVPAIAAGLGLPALEALAGQSDTPQGNEHKVKRFLQAIFNQRISGDDLDLIRNLGYDGVRVDVQMVTTPEEVAVLAQDCLDHDLTPLVIIKEAWQIAAMPAGSEIEVRNEPDIGTNEKLTVDEYMSKVFPSIDAARNREQNLGVRMPVWIGAVSNLNARGLSYLDEMFKKYWRRIPDDVGVTVHRYPNGGYDETLWKPHDGFSSREHEVARMKDIIAASPTQSFPYDRPYGVSEMGYHMGPRSKMTASGKKTTRWTEEDVYYNLRGEFNFWAEQKAAFCTVYQYASCGNEDDPGCTFGIRRVDGSLRPSAGIFIPR